MYMSLSVCVCTSSVCVFVRVSMWVNVRRKWLAFIYIHFFNVRAFTQDMGMEIYKMHLVVLYYYNKP